MQDPILCATCTTAIPFKVPELTGDRWHAHCPACGNATELQANLSGPEELATFSAVGAFTV